MPTVRQADRRQVAAIHGEIVTRLQKSRYVVQERSNPILEETWQRNHSKGKWRW